MSLVGRGFFSHVSVCFSLVGSKFSMPFKNLFFSFSASIADRNKNCLINNLTGLKANPPSHTSIKVSPVFFHTSCLQKYWRDFYWSNIWLKVTFLLNFSKRPFLFLISYLDSRKWHSGISPMGKLSCHPTNFLQNICSCSSDWLRDFHNN